MRTSLPCAGRSAHYTVRQAAWILGVTPSTVSRAIRVGILRAQRRQGRVVVPAYLREMAGLEDEAVIVGSRDHAEIWSPARWNDYRRALEDPDSLAKALDGLGI